MFIKDIPKTDRNTKKRYSSYRLCESYRVGEKTRHRTILNLGKLEELPNPADHKLLADRIEQIVSGVTPLFKPENTKIEELAQHFANILIQERLIDTTIQPPPQDTPPTDYQNVDVNSLEHKNVKEIGAEWLCKQTINRLDLEKHLKSLGWKEIWIKRAMIYRTLGALPPNPLAR